MYNGRLQSEIKRWNKTYNWYVSSPINNYGVNINISDYVSFSKSTKVKRNFRLYLLCFEGTAKAKEQFVPRMLKHSNTGLSLSTKIVTN
jgi:hypothetical protein